MDSNPDDRPTTAADFGNKLRHIQSRHGLTVDDMDLPTGGDGRGARGSSRYGLRRPKRAGCASSLAEDDLLLREGLASLLERSGFDVVGQAGDGTQLLPSCVK